MRFNISSGNNVSNFGPRTRMDHYIKTVHVRTYICTIWKLWFVSIRIGVGFLHVKIWGDGVVSDNICVPKLNDTCLKIWVCSWSGSQMGKKYYPFDLNDQWIQKYRKWDNVILLWMINMYDWLELLMNSKTQKCMTDSNDDQKCVNFWRKIFCCYVNMILSFEAYYWVTPQYMEAPPHERQT